jgi:hypothetical protein
VDKTQFVKLPPHFNPPRSYLLPSIEARSRLNSQCPGLRLAIELASSLPASKVARSASRALQISKPLVILLCVQNDQKLNLRGLQIMESSWQVETVRLCQGCVSLQLNTSLLSRIGEKGPFFTARLITLSPDHCSLCSLIGQCLQKMPLASSVHFNKNSGNPLQVDASETAANEAGTGCRDVVRRFEVQTSSKPKVKIARLWPCMYPIPSVGQVGDNDKILDMPFPSGRMIDSFVNVRLFKRWRQLCSDHHGDKCTRPPWMVCNDDVPPNFRVINVHTECVIDAPIKPSYFALSYVWGRFAENDLRATSENIDNLKKEHSLTQEVLPQTILDVMKLVFELGGKYLWVDRLCILQDDENEKARQIPCMDSIYSLAELTIIAASGSDAHDGVAGLSVPRSVE